MMLPLGTMSVLTTTPHSSSTLQHPEAGARKGGAPMPFEQHAAVVLGALQRSLAELLAATPGEVGRAKDVERTFGLDARLGWQIHRIATAANPLACGTSVPARVSMQRFLKAAARRRVPAAIVARVSDAFDELEQLVLDYAGDRERFESMVGSTQGEEAEDFDLKHKKAAHRANSHLWGVNVRASSRVMMIHPGAQGTIDVALLATYSDLHRLRSAAPLFIPLGSARVSEDANERGSTYVDRPIAALPTAKGAFLLREFSSPDLRSAQVVEGPGTSPMLLEIPEGVGLKNAVTVTTGSVSLGDPTPFGTQTPELHCTPLVRIPVEMMLVDMLIHQNAFPIRQPIPTRVGVIGNETREIFAWKPELMKRMETLAVREHCTHLGVGVELLGTPDLPRHVELLRSVCGAMSWNPNEFHVYRCRVEYPILRTSVRVEFDLTTKS